MHELALSQSVLEIVTRLAAGEGFHAVTRVVLEVGEAAGVETEALAFCFDAVTRDTMAQGAELHIEKVPARGHCGTCGQEFTFPAPFAPCPHCHAYGATMIAGRELRVREFEGA